MSMCRASRINSASLTPRAAGGDGLDAPGSLAYCEIRVRFLPRKSYIDPFYQIKVEGAVAEGAEFGIDV